jgi:hypothetical protein
MSCNYTSPNRRQVRLNPYQQALVRPAVMCLQLGASVYFGELLKQFMWPLMMVSLSVIAFVNWQANEKDGF